MDWWNKRLRIVSPFLFIQKFGFKTRIDSELNQTPNKSVSNRYYQGWTPIIYVNFAVLSLYPSLNPTVSETTSMGTVFK